MPPERDTLPDRSASPGVVYFAKCPEHGLHGERDECFECGQAVAQVGYVRADLHLQVAAANGRKAAELKRLRAENEQQRERIASLLLEEPSKSAGLYAAIDELQAENERFDVETTSLRAENEALRHALEAAIGLVPDSYDVMHIRALAHAAVASDDSLLPEEGR